METLDWKVFASIIGTVILILSFFGGVTIGVFKLVSTVVVALRENSFAISQINETLGLLRTRLDYHSEILDEHGNKIIKLETRLDYHERSGGK